MKKKLSALALAGIMIFSLCFATALAAADQYADAEELFQHWETAGYPAYVCGVWTEDNGKTLIVSVLDSEEGEAGKREILELIADDSSVSFEYGKYSKNDLLRAQNEINTAFPGKGVMSTALSEKENLIIVGVDMENASDELSDLTDSLSDRYGDRIMIVQGEEVFLTSGGEPSYRFAYFAALFTFAALITVMILAKNRRRVMAVQTNTGDIAAASDKLTKKQVEKLIKAAGSVPSKELDRRIGEITKAQ